MSITENDVVEYPESDGQPMGETDLHIYWTLRLRDLLKTHYQDQQVYVATDLLVYYEEGNSKKFIVPDVFVVFDCGTHLRRTFKIWEERRVPNVVFEVTSRSTAEIDLVEKPALYARLGIQEYFLFDPEADYLDPPLRGFRLHEGKMVEMTASNGCLQSLLCQCELKGEEGFLDLLDIDSQQPWLTAFETAERKSDYFREQCERMARELECQAKERELAAKEQERAAKERERAAKEQERAARLAAEAEISRLRAEIERLRRGG